MSEFLTADTKCKVCGKPIVAQVHTSYDRMGDPVKLLPMATCNRCYDFHDKRERLHEAIKKLCCQIIACGSRMEQPERERFESQLTTLTQKYSKLISDHFYRTGYVWDHTIVEVLMKKPEEWSRALRMYRDGLEKAA